MDIRLLRYHIHIHEGCLNKPLDQSKMKIFWVLGFQGWKINSQNCFWDNALIDRAFKRNCHAKWIHLTRREISAKGSYHIWVLISPAAAWQSREERGEREITGVWWWRGTMWSTGQSSLSSLRDNIHQVSPLTTQCSVTSVRKIQEKYRALWDLCPVFE